jgi:hypothetical protein
MNTFKIHFNRNRLCVALLQERMREVKLIERALFYTNIVLSPPSPSESKHGRQRQFSDDKG